MNKRNKWILGISAFIICLVVAAVPLLNAAFSCKKAEVGAVSGIADNAYESSTEVKVLSYNMAHCRGSYDFYGKTTGMDDLDMDLTIDSPEQVYKCLDDFAEFIVNEKADIVLLQEVDKDAVWSFGIDFMPYLAEKSGLGYYSYGTKHDLSVLPYMRKKSNGDWIYWLYFDIGNAVLSKYPIVSAENKGFGEKGFKKWISGEEKYVDAVVDVKGKMVRVVSTHFGSGLKESLKMIEEAEKSEMPFVFGGTLHILLPAARETCSWCSNEYMNAMQNLIDSGLFNIYMTGVDALDTQYFTADTENLYWTADYIIPTKDVEIKDYYVIDVELSDHKPVAATLVLNDSQ
ncbi:MAG: endonuclease/exonuclease/phosphatase family protein [Nanoarchaeota archaeon]|nr:endonuclease/exonuclease/phosphatase family protein [Nanoarchaeota archaeon]